jgi:hypothetical protein
MLCWNTFVALLMCICCYLMHYVGSNLFYMQIIECVKPELYINNFKGTEEKINYIWGYVNRKRWIPLFQSSHLHFSLANSKAQKAHIKFVTII